ncbi:MAG: SulP family inorganic anion transporter [Taibaiella sp.]|nr:SulP family inorganic anion transporter [Taibaiella sp.]
MKPKVYSADYFRKDFLAGLIVFLIALPLCLGIAQASHAPLFSGIVAGIVGGIVIGSLSGSQLSVSGPAAGLTAIVFVAIDKMQHFDIFLCSVIIAGAVQMVLGFIKAGGIANYIPSSVIEGMLAGIGLTIIIKQLPDAVGYAKNQSAFMFDADDGFVMNRINLAMHHIQEGALIISVIGLAILILWTSKPLRRLQMLPGALVVVVVGTLVNIIFNEHAPILALESTHLVKLPVAASTLEFFKQFAVPNFQGFADPKVWETGLVIAIVASIETLLCIEATDKMDPMKRYTSTNRELKAQGVGNIVSGLIGGLPITSVIVRSSANVNSGAKSKMSAVIHGILLLACAATIPVILNMIPKASLAAILLFTGYKLCKPSSIVHMWKGGVTQFLPFVITAVGVVSLDLLKGVGLGLVISVLFILRQNAKISYFMQRTPGDATKPIRITLAQEVSFLNKAAIKETLHQLPEDSEVIIDANKSQYIDFDVLDMIKDFAGTRAPEKNIRVILDGFKDQYKANDNNGTEVATKQQKEVLHTDEEK